MGMKPRDDFERQIVALSLDEVTTSNLIIAYRSKCCKEGEEWPLDRSEHAELITDGRIVRPLEMFRTAITVAAKAWWHAGTRRSSRAISIGEIDADGVEIILDINKLTYLENRAKLLQIKPAPLVKKEKKVPDFIKFAVKEALAPKVEHRNLDDLPDWDDDEALLSDADIEDLIKQRN
jgi:hypothetical protein